MGVGGLCHATAALPLTNQTLYVLYCIVVGHRRLMPLDALQLIVQKLRHWTNGFTSLPKEGVLRIFSPWKIQRLRPGLNPQTWVPKASMLTARPPKPLNQTLILTKLHGITFLQTLNFIFTSAETTNVTKLIRFFQKKKKIHSSQCFLQYIRAVL